jgi:proliferating cell nuclear antigen
MAAAADGNDELEQPEITATELKDEIEISRQPAQALVNEVVTRAGLASFMESDSDWSDIDGVGPVTAETLEESEDALESIAGEPTIDQEEATEPATEDSDSTEGDVEETEEGEEEVNEEVEDEEEDSEEDSESAEEESDDSEEPSAGDDEDDSTSEESDGEEETKSRVEKLQNPREFTATIKQSRLGDVVSAAHTLVSEALVAIHEDRIRIRAVDAANVAMVDETLSNTAFDSWEATPGVIGVNLNRVDDILSMGKADDDVHLDFDAETRKLEFCINGLEYSLATIDPESIRARPDLPELNLPFNATLDSEVIEKATKAGNMLGDHMHIKTEDADILEFHVEGDTDEMTKEVRSEEVSAISKDNEDVMSIFALDYVTDLKRVIKNADEFEMKLGHEMPLILDLSLSDDHCDVTYFLAPRIQST